MLSKIILILFISLTELSLAAQDIWKDTIPTVVDLRNFHLSNKIVRAEYGKVIMYFNQADYLKTTIEKDTVRITPKYFSDSTITRLLKKGNVKIIRRSDDSVETQITHYLKQFGSMCDRVFELHDGVSFFTNLEIIGLVNWSFREDVDSMHKTQKVSSPPVEEFAYKDEFPNTADTGTIKIKDYFPRKPSVHYVYNDNEGYGELDTNVCKMSTLNGKSIFYFAKCFNKFEIVSTGTPMFGNGVYFYQNGALFVIETDYEKDIKSKNYKDAALLIPSLIKPGDSTILNRLMGKKVLTFLKREDLQVGDKTYKDCIKLKIKSYWSDTIYLEYIWLKRDLGLVKWMRSTGRIEELVDCF